MGFSTVTEISLILYILSFSSGWNWTVSWYERQEIVSSFSSCWRSAGSRPHEWGSGCVQTQHSGTTKVVVVIFKFLLLDLASSSVVIRPYHFSANLSYSSNKQGLGTTTCCYIKLFHSQTTLYMSRWFVTSPPTSPLCILLPLGLHTSPPTFSIPQTSSDLVPQPPSCLFGLLFLHSVLSSTKLSRASTFSLFILWTNSYNVTILMNPLWKNFA